MAREVMESVEGVERLHMSGTRAVLTLDEGAQLDPDWLADAFEDKGLAFDSIERVTRPVAREVLLVGAGVT